MTNLIRLHSFDGGIHPAENKTQSTQTPIRVASLPDELILPVHQHIGAAARPLVQAGDSVLKGQRIAEAEGFVSVPLHAPTSGTVVAVEDRPVPHASGLEELCIVIRPDGRDQWLEHQSLYAQLGVEHLTDITPRQLVEHIRNSGIAGMGGAGFPTAVKLNVGQNPIHTLILNGAECEPYITADDMLMRERAAEVIQGALILQHIVGSKRCLIGVEDNKPEAIAALEQALVQLDQQHHIDVVSIPTKYPSGGEKQLIKILTGEEVPAGGIPANLGLVCQNVGTAAAVYRAVQFGEPLISRITTVTGDAVQQPGNFEVLIGTPVAHLLQLAGYRAQKRERVIMGGPMMGFALPQLQLPITKTSNCLLAPTEQELPPNDIAMACIRCGLCVDACPADLLPQQLYWFSKAQEFEKAEQHNIFDCIECGACSYVCPSHIPLVQYYRYAKGAIREDRAAKAKAERARLRFEERLARQEREAAEKEAKRKARAEAAAKAQAEKPAVADTAAAPAAAVSSADLDKLQKQLDATQSAIAKTKEKLAAARADETQADKVPVLEAALAKTQDKLKALAKDIAAAKKAAKAAEAAAPAADAALTATDKGDPNSPERLQRKWETAKARLDTALQRLAEAQAQGLDTIAALQAGIDKQQERVNEAHAAWQAALNGEAPAATAAPDAAAQAQASADAIDALQKKILAQQDRVTKMQERHDMAKAEGLDTVEALALGVQKQQDKLHQLQQELAALPGRSTPANEA
ncbi:electron transport complex subunit RsxC [Venatoribacter cucullus]|uniref:electron transport complex subunit RsxC n=1 Tax=Venatoribacter cucullus TaxID=2661630 RepID=UPI00223FA04E|nr:electron transport complex subunit RsxC [Venatoribacter cucullus]UZK03821.1 electron transport complex subunit RsxC [Venatoribacter cucullus]